MSSTNSLKDDPLEILKRNLAEAKRLNDTKLANKIRQDIWVLRDTSSGHSPAISSDEVTESLGRIAVACKKGEPPKKEAERTSFVNPFEKSLHKLEKKLKQIDALKERQKNGEKLEKTQITKIESEENVKQEIEEVKKTLASMAVSR
ncbi:uncharacterized protein LOC135690568 [Rhopilema esculentum]|uniref:uncharacterized protein LOC135690568 n=1 Tax=Rhopilema esculentum TaxID=499914 RepID=UPI0031DECD1D